jgi:hypothetical protein
MEAALGFSVHTGWAALVAVAGRAVVDRRRVELLPDRERFVYHAARELARPAAERSIRAAEARSLAAARAAIEQTRATLAAGGRELVACGIVVGNRPAAAALEEVLASHALIHAAEGELARQAIRAASARLGLRVAEIGPRDLEPRAAAALGIPAAEVAPRLAGIGRAAGRPWAKDQKDACLAALIALAAGSW